jgi:mRNA-degrading endonuclease RelE of RelBE toxin-antitoxin system
LKATVWTEQAKADVRALDRPTAMRILYALHRFAESSAGDLKRLRDQEEIRFRIGDYRLFLHRSEA